MQVFFLYCLHIYYTYYVLNGSNIKGRNSYPPPPFLRQLYVRKKRSLVTPPLLLVQPLRNIFVCLPFKEGHEVIDNFFQEGTKKILKLFYALINMEIKTCMKIKTFCCGFPYIFEQGSHPKNILADMFVSFKKL